MRKRKNAEKMADQFQKLAQDLEKLLGLGDGKTSAFLSQMSKTLPPLLENLETAILKTKSLPLDLLRSTFQAYLKDVAKNTGVSWKDLKEVSQDLFKLLDEWFQPEAFQAAFYKLVQTLFFRGNLESEVDEFGMDPSVVEVFRPLCQFLYYDYWRVSVQGIGNIPSRGRCLLVANHSGGLPYDGAMLTVACLNEHPAHRQVRFLIEDFVYHFPFMGTLMSRLGAVRACPENAAWLLKKNELVLVFPEGVKGLGKLYEERYQLKRFGRGGFIKLAIQNKTSIAPVAIIGAEEIHPILWKSNILAKAMGVPYLPVTPTFPWLGPLGMIPLPTKWKIVVGKPISFNRYKPHQAEDGLLVHKLSEQVQTTIQSMVDKEIKKRKSVWLG